MIDTSEAKLGLGKGKPSSSVWWALAGLGVALFGLGASLLLNEIHTSHFQSMFFSRAGRHATFAVEPGPSKDMRFPAPGGPYDQRLGYVDLPRFLQRLQQRGYAIDAQARQSPDMIKLTDRGVTGPLLPLGLFPPYREKDQGGLLVRDGYGRPIYQSQYPQRVYGSFESLPRLLVSGLLYIENHTLLDDSNPQQNPAIEWSRFGKALADESLHLFRPGYHSAGASTLATQIEKFRHSPGGRTGSPKEKLRQMLSASVRAYHNGEDTTAFRRQLVVEYLNTVPLAARAGFGEISGIGDGMWAWYGRSFDEMNRTLANDSPPTVDEQATVFKEALSLMISQRGPSAYLNGDMKVLEDLTDSYLRLMARDKVISQELCDAALKVSLRQQKEKVSPAVKSLVERKGANAVRIKLAGMLGMPRLYDLDHVDVEVGSTLDSQLQQSVTDHLMKLRDPEYAKSAGLGDKFLLQQGSPEGVTYSFTLIERTPFGNKVRVQADNFDQPFDINEGTKLDLGSTSKLRTLVTYLEVIADLHRQYAGLSREALGKIRSGEHESVLRRWAIDYLRQNDDRSLPAMLAASLERKYSASPGESFFTGGGRHTFENFDKNDNGRILSLREATQRSVNLVYIRVMRDIVRYYMYPAGYDDTLMGDKEDPRRREYLQRFADKEGKTFMAGFYHKYRGKSADQIDALLVEKARRSPKRLAVIFRSIRPTEDQQAMAAFIARHANPPAKLEPKTLARLYDELGPDRFNLADRGYLAGVHPLELWMVAYLHGHPGAEWSEMVQASAAQRQEVYQWLFNSKHKGGQDNRIRQIQEADAFRKIHAAWKRMGYPFDSLVPSYATALGASADRPASLAELMGILSNDGVRLPTVYIDKMRFAEATPYETSLAQAPTRGVRVLPPEIPQLVRQVLSEVVDKGTAHRVAGAFDRKKGEHTLIGGKTGTGDNRFKTFSRGGGLTSARVVSRSGAFVFYIGDHYFGTIVAYVAGPKAADYKFTSALPVQVLKVLAPTLLPRLDYTPRETSRGADSVAEGMPDAGLPPGTPLCLVPSMSGMCQLLQPPEMKSVPPAGQEEARRGGRGLA
ncbi:glycosyl transferase family 51 [Chromobacterium violaceum]|uniref:transglycosylase domain-containing protein n=1 Tax=Chromobacterium violaceum TaxID=536 RepID=UPI0009D94403|nr:transglycosylase domain-containing protein [Chromobacterium violaceum]OQS12212.1 glycosyl transferase family 51 [Chromobacterium violaceum]OQS28352.1 glycosyl transferase family 51 [Chromobacterium violaceum]